MQAALFLNRAEALERLVVPGGGTVRIEMIRSQAAFSDDLWTGICRAPNGAELVRAMWSATNGELVSVSHVISPQTEHPVVSGRGTATRIAWDWAHMLGMAGRNGPWQTTHVIHQSPYIWLCVFTSGNRRTLVEISVAGELVMALASTVDASGHTLIAA